MQKLRDEWVVWILCLSWTTPAGPSKYWEMYSTAADWTDDIENHTCKMGSVVHLNCPGLVLFFLLHICIAFYNNTIHIIRD
jgi:hypothetical protein